MKAAIIYCVVVVVLILLILYYTITPPKCDRNESFEIFGATAPYADFYQTCVSECEKYPKWETKDPTKNKYLCSLWCNNIVTGMRMGNAEKPKFNTIDSESKKECGGFQNNKCVRDVACAKHTHNWCNDECGFGGYTGREKEKCINECQKITKPNCAWGDWSFK
jgi:hypothetical protein